MVLRPEWTSRLALVLASLVSLGTAGAACGGDPGSEGDPSAVPNGRNGRDGGTDPAPDGGKVGTDGGTETPRATHFDPTPIEWSLPAGGVGDRSFFSMRARGTMRDEDMWSTLDLTGDGLPDLVSHGHWSTQTWGTKGSWTWKVFKNNGRGFDAAALTWPVPDGGWGTSGSLGFGDSSSGPTQVGADVWETFDITGDGLADIVATGAGVAVQGGTAADAFGTAGNQRHWKVFKNTGSGFEKTMTTWKLPDGGYSLQTSFSRTAFDDRDNSPDQRMAWATFDIDGDKRPDLVVTGRGVGTSGVAVWGSTGSQHWQVYRNNGTSFETLPTTWPVPDGGLGARGYWGVEDANGDPDLETWGTEDVTGDGLPDLVVTGRAIGGIITPYGDAGARYWRIFANNGAGFDKTAIDWRIPERDDPKDYFFCLHRTATADGGDSWSTVDMTGDGRADLVHTAKFTAGAENQLGTAGSRHWKVFANNGKGFDATAITWTSPDGGYGAEGYSVPAASAVKSRSLGGELWWTVDVDDDRVPDLVVTGRSPEANAQPTAWGTAPKRYWKVFRGIQ